MLLFHVKATIGGGVAAGISQPPLPFWDSNKQG